MKDFSYYEYKYLVNHKNFETVKDILDHFYGLSDPYASGVVDSIYYDTPDRFFYQQCLNGEEWKYKFRIRGYGDNKYHQAHQKIKHMFGVSKYKAKIKEKDVGLWHELISLDPSDQDFSMIMHHSSKYGVLYPAVRIRYDRYRYRLYDDRITFDTNIEASSVQNGIPNKLSQTMLDHHVLEIKTNKERPNLPFVGLIKLTQVSYSKFMLGISQLNPI